MYTDGFEIYDKANALNCMKMKIIGYEEIELIKVYGLIHWADICWKKKHHLGNLT